MKIKQMLFLMVGFLLQGCNKVEHIYIEASKFEKFYKSRKILPILVDTRSVKEYANSHVESALNIPAKELFLLKNLNEIKNIKNAQKHKNWVLFLYAKNKEETEYLKNKMEELCTKKFKFNSPNAVYYLENGYESLVNP